MHTTLGGIDRVRVCVDRFGVGAGPLHRDFDRHGAFSVLIFKVNDFAVDDFSLLRFVNEVDVVTQAALVHVSNLAETGNWIVIRSEVVPGDLVTLVNHTWTFIREGDPQTLVQESHLLEAATQNLERELNRIKN